MLSQYSDDTWASFIGDLRFSLASPTEWSTQQRSYLSHYLPGRLGDGERGTYQINIHIDRADHDQIVWQAMQPPIARHIETVPSVVLWEKRTTSGTRYYTMAADGLEHQQAGAYVVHIDEQHMDLYLRRTPRKSHSYPLRLMREVMVRTYENHGGVIFHAAGADLADKGVMICGPRSVGKTTLLTCLLRLTGGALLSNDRLVLEPSGRLIAVPLPVPIAKGTIEAVDELRNAVHQLSRPQRKLNALSSSFGATEKAEFSAREYATALGTTLSPGSWLQTIMVPRLTDDYAPVQVRELSRDHARRVLGANCFTPHDEFWKQPWLVPRTAPNVEFCRHAEHLVQCIAAQVRCFEVAFGVRNPLTELDNGLLTLLERQS